MVWPILLLGLVSAVVFVERLFFLHKGQIRTGEFLEGIKNLLSKKRLLEALTLCEETAGPVASVVKAALVNFESDETKMRTAMSSAALVEIPMLERRLGTLAMVAKVAPLFGFIGTVLALMNAFFALQKQGVYADSVALHGWIAHALISTVLGLIVAVLAFLFLHFLSGRVRALIHDMEWVGNEMVQLITYDLKALQSESEPASHS